MLPHAGFASTQRKGIAAYISQTGCVDGLSGVADLCGVGLSCVWFGACRFTDGVWHGVVPAEPVCSVCWCGWWLACVRGMWKREGARWWCPLPVRFGCGGVLLSHTLPGAVPSPCQVLASGFGMGPGVSPGPWPPQILCYTSHGIVSPRVPLGDRGGLGTG